MDKETLNLNQLSVQLVERLHVETRKFMEEYKTANPSVVIGAANLYLSSIMMQAPSKDNAMNVLEADFDVIRTIVLQTPDGMFRNPHVKES